MKIESAREGGLHHLLREGHADFPLRSRGHKLLLILVVGIPAVVLAFKVARIAMAARLASRTNTSDLRRAIALDPGNAAYDDRLGLVDAYSFDQEDFHEAVKYLRKATELEPLKAGYWSDLAEACDLLNNTTCSDPAVRRALSLSPMAPRFEWRAGNHYLERGQTGEALKHFRRLLALDDTYARPVFRICLGAVGDAETVFQKVLPPGAGPQLKLTYLDFVSAHGDLDFANQLWCRLSSDGFSCRFSEVKPYLDRLLCADDIQQATKVWRDLERVGVIPKPAVGGIANLIYNGGFEHDPLNVGFGWCVPNTLDVETDFRDPSAYQGSRCLRVDYAGGQNLESQSVCELVPVEPQQAYRLRAYVRSDDITSDSGPRLRVADAECSTCLSVSTETTVGTTPWHLLTLYFTTGPRTRLIWLSLWRPRSWTFPMEISGSFWLDEVSLEAVNSMPKEMVSTH